MIASAESSPQEVERQQSFISEVFHDLSQPLTALHCSLELSLDGEQTVEKLHTGLAVALENAERLRQRLLLMWALNDAFDPGDISSIDLIGLLHESHQELLPLFESAGQEFDLQIGCAPCQIRANKVRLKRALFYFLEYLFRYSPEGAVLTLCVDSNEERQVEISIAAASGLPVSSSADHTAMPQAACEIEIARRSFRAAGGEFALVSYASNHTLWLATLPMA